MKPPYANAWFTMIGPNANTIATAAMAIVLKAMVVLESIDLLTQIADIGI
jgi:hypothetical protein